MCYHIPVNFAFNLPQYVTSYIHHTDKKGEQRRDFQKRKKNKVTKNLLQGDTNPDPKNQLELRMTASILWNTSVKTDS